ncbi:MAG: radical SAM protein [Candidatus Nanoarchaeia archaeon]
MKTKAREGYYGIILKLPRFVRRTLARTIYTYSKFQLKRLKTPQNLIFFVTDRCNLNCSHCFYAKHLNRKTQEMSLDQIEKIIRSLKNRLTSIVLTGGETYLRGDLVEVCKLFDKINHTKKITLATNGTLPDLIYNKTKEILDNTNLDIAVQVSLDGLKETHDKIRGVKGTFDRVIETVKKLKTLNNYKNFSLSLSTTVCKENYNEIEDLIKFVQDNLKVFHGLQFVRDSHKHSYNIDKNILSDFTASNTLSLQQMKEMNKKLEKLTSGMSSPLLLKVTNIFDDNAISILENKKRLMDCLAGKVDGVVFTNGDVSFCEFTKPFANLKEFDYNFYKLWTSEKANIMRSKLTNCVCIHPCNMINSMRYDLKSIRKIFNC